MMMGWDKKKQMQTMLQKRSAGGSIDGGPTPMKAQNVSDEDGMPDGRHMAMQDMMMAMKGDDSMKAMDALKSFMDMHMSESNKPAPKE